MLQGLAEVVVQAIGECIIHLACRLLGNSLTKDPKKEREVGELAL